MINELLGKSQKEDLREKGESDGDSNEQVAQCSGSHSLASPGLYCLNEHYYVTGSDKDEACCECHTDEVCKMCLAVIRIVTTSEGNNKAMR